MSNLRFQSSTADPWTAPRAHSDPTMRRLKYGPIRPMYERPSFLHRLLGR